MGSLKKIARVVLQMSLAMDLEPVRFVGATAQKCDAVDDRLQLQVTVSAFFIVCLAIFILLAVCQVWRIFIESFGNLEG